PRGDEHEQERAVELREQAAPPLARIVEVPDRAADVPVEPGQQPLFRLSPGGAHLDASIICPGADAQTSTSSHDPIGERDPARRAARSLSVRRCPGITDSEVEAITRPSALVSAAGRPSAVSAGSTRFSRLATSTSAAATPSIRSPAYTGRESVIVYWLVQK